MPVGVSVLWISFTFLTLTEMNRTELFEFLYDKCYESPELLDAILREYVDSLSDSKLTELEDFLTNNFGDD